MGVKSVSSKICTKSCLAGDCLQIFKRNDWRCYYLYIQLTYYILYRVLLFPVQRVWASNFICWPNSLPLLLIFLSHSTSHISSHSLYTQSIQIICYMIPSVCVWHYNRPWPQSIQLDHLCAQGSNKLYCGIHHPICHQHHLIQILSPKTSLVPITLHWWELYTSLNNYPDQTHSYKMVWIQQSSQAPRFPNPSRTILRQTILHQAVRSCISNWHLVTLSLGRETLRFTSDHADLMAWYSTT